MKRYWELAYNRIDGMALRERITIFLAVAFMMISLVSTTLLDPLLTKQEMLSAQVMQKQERLKELQAQLQAQLQARRDDQNSPLRIRLAQLKKQLQEHEVYLQSRSDRLVDPDKMARLLEQVLNKNDRLQLMELVNLSASPLFEKHQQATAQTPTTSSATARQRPDLQKQLYRHGIRITVRGNYQDMLRYLAALEALPVQMFWGDISLNVEKHPDAVLTLTLYTLSLDKTWLTT